MICPVCLESRKGKKARSWIEKFGKCWTCMTGIKRNRLGRANKRNTETQESQS